MGTELIIRPPSLFVKGKVEDYQRMHSVSHHFEWDKRKSAYRMPFSPETLIKTKEFYPDAEVVEGQQYIDLMKSNLINLKQGKQLIKENKAVPPNRKYKMTPFDHQYRGMAYLNVIDGAAIFADCGTGKTAMTLWDIETKYEEGKLDPSSVLVVGKLMTLFSGWQDDTSDFTDLNAEVLWAPTQSKVVKGEKEIIHDHGKKPAGKPKYFSKTEYFHKNGDPAILAGPRHFNPRKHVCKLREWKQVGDEKYGKETLTATTRINLRTENIRRLINSSEHSIHIINHEGLIQFTEELRDRRYKYIVIDESTAIKNCKAKIFPALLEVSQHAKFRRILSGTPSPQGPQDLWSQFYFLDGGLTMGPDFDIMIDQHFDRIELGSHERGTYKGEMIRPSTIKNTHGWVASMLKDRIFSCKIRDCIDLPPMTSKVLDVFLSEEQEKHYRSMVDEMFIDLDEQRIEVTVELARAAKLRQITGGFIINKSLEVKEVCKKNPKLQALESLIKEVGHEEKIVIFAVHRCEIKMLLEHFGNKAVAIYGGVSDKKKFDAQRQFIKNPDCKYIICQPQSAAYGVDGLQKVSSRLVFYSLDYRADSHYQAIKRIERAGQQFAMFVYYLIAKNTIDEDLYKIVHTKEKMQKMTIAIKILEGLRSKQGG